MGRDRGIVIGDMFRLWTDLYGLIRIEEWPEGLVVWVGGKIRWKSWNEREYARQARRKKSHAGS